MANVWDDMVDPREELHVHLVAPQVSDMHPSAVAHVLLLQRPHPDFCPIVVSIVDEQVLHGRPRSWALMTPAQVLKQTIVASVGYRTYCDRSHMRCEIRHGQAEIQDDGHFQLRHGMHLQLFVVYTFLQAPITVWDDDGMNLLQLKVDRPILALDSLLSSPPRVALRLFSAVDSLKVPDYVEIHEPVVAKAVERLNS